MIRVLQSMSNNPHTFYFDRFAEVHNRDEIELDFLLLCKEKPTLGEQVNQFGCKVHWIQFDHTKRKTHYLKALLQGIKLLRNLKPDILHVHLFDDALPLLIAAKIAGIKHKVISKLDVGYHINNNPFFIKFDKLNNRLSDEIITVSQDCYNIVKDTEKANPSKISIIPQGFPFHEVLGNDEALQKELKSKFKVEDSIVFLTICRFIPLKGYDYLIEALEKLKKKGLRFKAIFVGYGDQQSYYEEQVKEKGLENEIEVSGYVDRETLNNLYKIANIFIHPAIVEPFGFVIPEAILNGTPAVCTKVGSAPEAIIHKETGFLAETKSSESLVEGIEYILANLNQALIDKGIKLVEEKFTLEQMWKGHRDIYERLEK